MTLQGWFRRLTGHWVIESHYNVNTYRILRLLEYVEFCVWFRNITLKYNPCHVLAKYEAGGYMNNK